MCFYLHISFNSITLFQEFSMVGIILSNSYWKKNVSCVIELALLNFLNFFLFNFLLIT